MLVSVVMPVFNGRDHVESAIARVLAQEGVELELVVVDDGSTDGSASLALAAAASDARVTVVALAENGGVANAREQGVRSARGEWIWFVDADDSWTADSVAALTRPLDVPLGDTSEVPDVVVASARLVVESGSSRVIVVPPGPPVSGVQAFEMLLAGRLTGHLWNKLFRRSLLLGVPFPRARVQSDLALVAQVLAAAGSVAFVDAVVYEYRKRAGSIITSRSRRAESLQVVDAAVAAAARVAGPGVADGEQYRYFRLRYITLSGLKDAVSGPYDGGERAALVQRLRRHVDLRALGLLARHRDWRRLVLAISARISLVLYRRLLVLADR